ncbi:MAG: YkvA family protein [bacterium]|nr:YkvA family protein [bacterium]
MLKVLRQKAEDLKQETYALYLAYRDPRVPWYAKAVAAATVAYAVSPIDLIPDFIPVIGYLDDLVLVPLGIALSVRLIPAGIMAECRQKAHQKLSGTNSLGLKAAAVVVLIWLLSLAFLVWLVIKTIGKH